MVLQSIGSMTNSFGKQMGFQTPPFGVALDSPVNQREDWSELYAILLSYYKGNNVYDSVQVDNTTTDMGERILGLRNPAHRSVEFYVSTIWPGTVEEAFRIVPLKIVAETTDEQGAPILLRNDQIIEPLQQLWTWSNWGQVKQVLVRWSAIFGDVFVKVAERAPSDPFNPSDRGRVFLQLIDPASVTDFDVDERGFVTYIRMEIEQTRREPDGRIVEYVMVDIWDKAVELRAIWSADRRGMAIDLLGEPDEVIPFSEYGISFIPIGHGKFRDTGELRGIGAFTHALDKIDEVNRMVTQLHRMLYRWNRPFMAIEQGGFEAEFEPLAGPRSGLSVDPNDMESDDMTRVSEIGGDNVVSVPGRMTTTVPNVNYGASLEGIREMQLELENELPELAWARLRTQNGNLSGAAMRVMLSDAVYRVVEARGNLDGLLVRLDKMALTIGIARGIWPATLGRYEDGDFEHGFMDRPVFPLSPLEIAAEEQAVASAKATKLQLGWSRRAIMREMGLTEDQIAGMEAELDDEQRKAQEMLDVQADRAMSALIDEAIAG